MIIAAPTMDYSFQLFRNVFARLMSETWQVGAHTEQVFGWKAASPKSGAERYLGVPVLIDGEWPRLVHLNQPLHPNFWQRRQSGSFCLAGQFRRAEFYTAHRERIKREWFSFGTDWQRPVRRVLVCGTLARVKGKGEKRQYCIRPTPQELRFLLPNVDFYEVQVLLPALFKKGYLRSNYDDTAAKLIFVDQTTTVAMARRADVVLANLSAHAWWAGFLSFAETTILLTYGGEDRPCKACETALVGKPKLGFIDATTQHVNLPLILPNI